MSKEKIRKEIQKLQRTVKNAPRILSFRGRRVVRADDWKHEDWTTLPDKFWLGMGQGAADDWLCDVHDLLVKLEDPELGRHTCYDCAINQAQGCKAEIERGKKFWEDQGGEEGKQKFYEKCGEPKTSEFRRQEGMENVKWRIYSELAGANNRTCQIINYFKCPYEDERKQLVADGKLADKLWKHLKWYDRHWHRSTSMSGLNADPEWYHFNEPDIINVADFDDITKAFDDGRIVKIIEEHERYMKENKKKIWDL